MHTLETMIILPIILLFLMTAVCISLKYTEVISKHADSLKSIASEKLISNTEIVRGGDILNETYEEYLS